MNARTRRSLPHEIPSWADPSAHLWFITICCQDRKREQLTIPSVSKFLLESVAHRHHQRDWYAHLFLLMPDHCHALLSFPIDQPVMQTIRNWKRWSARQIGVKWQTDFFDHRLRGDESFGVKSEYIRQNPVRAGLVARVEDWPHLWCGE